MHFINSLNISIISSLITLALALFEQCNHAVDLKAGQKIYINSPYYPQQYPVGTSCRYTVKAPLDHELSFKCKIQLNAQPAATRCHNEIFYFNREGSELLSGSEYFCGSGTMERKSFLNHAVISYISTAAATPPPYKRHHLKPALAAIKGSTKNSLNTTTSTTVSAASSTTSPSVVVNPPAVNFSNALAYVTALLSNNFYHHANNVNISTIATALAVATTTAAAATPSPFAITTHTTNSNYYNNNNNNNNNNIVGLLDILQPSQPSITWRNGTSTSVATSASSFSSAVTSATTSKSSVKRERAGKIVVGHPDVVDSNNFGVAGGGGAFSCLVEVIEPQCECGLSTNTKVSGATGIAGINEFPSMAGVLTLRYNQIFCGASIIHHRYLLSAAHCFITPETNRSELIRIVVGEHDFSTVLESLYTRTYEIDSIMPHEHFLTTSTNVRNDIAILRTRYSIEWNRSVGPACLPFRSITGTDGGRKPPIAGQRVETAGWGTTSFGGPQSTRLLKTTLDVIATDQCKRAVHSLPSATFCTYTPGSDTCQYDSGGALYVRDQRLFAVGIVSYGYACASQQPSVNTKVASFIRWIKSKTTHVKYCIK